MSVVDSELESALDDLRFGPVDEWSVDVDGVSLDGFFGCEIGQELKGMDEFRSAIGVAAIVDGIDAYIDIVRGECFGPTEGE